MCISVKVFATKQLSLFEFFLKSSCAFTQELFSHFSPKCVIRRKSRQVLEVQNPKPQVAMMKEYKYVGPQSSTEVKKTQGVRRKVVTLQHLPYKIKKATYLDCLTLLYGMNRWGIYF